jgi:hypothetical protein
MSLFCRPSRSTAKALPVLLALILLLSACQAEPPAATIAEQTVAEPATATPAASQTPLPPTAAPTTTPEPTVTSQATAAATATEPANEPTATATATLIPGMIGPYDFPANVNPLTGLVVADSAVLQRRPLAVKISNLDRVRPQSGINSADLVFEHLTEGNITRFTAIFYTHDVEKVGSIRSGRLIDLEIPIMYDAAFAYSGSVGLVRLMFRDSSFFDRIISPDFAHGGFERIADPSKPNQPSTDTLFTNLYTLRWILDQRDQNTPPIFQTNMAFHPDPPANGTPAESIGLDYTGTYVFWQYNPARGRYLRWSDGLVHEDAGDSQQLNFKNIVVVGAHHETTDIVENTGGGRSIQIQIWGEGPVSVFRNGQRFEGRWRREDSGDMLTFYDLDGNLLPLEPGNTFFQVVPLGFTSMVVNP